MVDSDRIWAMARGFQASRVLLTGVELGVFGALEGFAGGRASEDVATDLGTDPRATDRLMNALVALGLLRKEDGRFLNAPLAHDNLLQGGRGGAGDALLHTVRLWETWSGLTESVRTGRASGAPSALPPDVATRGFIAAMDYGARERAPAVAEAVDLSGANRMLDIGGGSGAYAMAFCRARPELEAVVFDLPSVTLLTRSYIQAEGLGDRVKTVDGDYLSDDLGRGFDLVLFSMILHSNPPEACAALLAKGHAALLPGGQVVVQELVVSEDRTEPRSAALFSLNMLVGVGSGDAYTESEIAAWLREAGFDAPRRVDLNTSTLLIARRP